ncbi:hypothetical protein SAMN06265795_1312 [Noviherbaspirillum humi]|uniref:Uncharacterized protein n=1 Tax=Noviherbaspirillum humi TaxID=1688639 RepID=A0A239M587_9BURK|nr:hypothetical protein [Noviherbaspirillum humi]SNT37338.1 hypothetical protein SAMN06265795_1312 [Noviherbaspirillum humi]
MQTSIELTVQTYVSWEDQKHDIDVFADWLKINTPDFFILPPVTILTLDGHEKLVFVMRKQDMVIGIFESPSQALHALGEVRRSFHAFRHHGGAASMCPASASTARNGKNGLSQQRAASKSSHRKNSRGRQRELVTP